MVNLDPSWTLEVRSLLTALSFDDQGEDARSLTRHSFPQDFSDPASLNFYHSKKAELRKEFGEEEPDMADVLALMRRKARDAGRTPMQVRRRPPGPTSLLESLLTT